MAFRPGRKEKLAGGIILVSFGIFLMHYFIFQPKQGDYREAKVAYDATAQRYAGMKSAPINEIPGYLKETTEKEALINELIAEIKPCYASYFSEAERMQADFLELVRQIDGLRTKHPTVKWDFLGDKGWDFSQQLPEPIRRGQIVIQDLVNNIKAGDRLIQRITDPNEKSRHLNSYINDLTKLGVNMNKALAFKNSFGDVVPNLYLAHHAMLIVNAMPREGAMTVPQMLEFLRPGFEKKTFYEGVVMHTTNKQLEALVDILDSAAQHNIENVSSVTMFQNKNIMKKFDIKDGTPTPTPAPYGDFMMFEESMMMGMMEGAMFPGMMPGMMPGATAPAASPEEFVANVTGFKIRFQAQNSNAMQYLYDLANSRRAYAIDDLAVNSIKDGKVDVFVTVVAYTWIADVCN